MLNTPFSPWPDFTEEEAQAVADVVRSNRVNYWTGDRGRAFENSFAAFAGTRHAIALANGTLALDLALHGLGIGSVNGGSVANEVIVTPRSFIASASCVVNAGATPVFADVDRDSGNLSAATIEVALTPNTRAIIVVHLGGWPCDMDPIMELAHSRGIKVIEDCAQAHGARYKGRSVGSLGDVGAWSFCQDKIMTTGGEGGMVTCNDEAMWSRMWSFKDHGKSFDAVYKRDHPPGFRWLHETIGTNWRMLEMQAAIGLVQLGRMPQWSVERLRIADSITHALSVHAGASGVVRIPKVSCAGCNGGCGERGCRHAHYRFYAYVRPENLAPGWSRDRIVEEIKARGVPAYQGSCSEIYREKAFAGTPWEPPIPLPVARELGETSLMLLTHPTLTAEEVRKTGDTVSSVLAMATAR